MLRVFAKPGTLPALVHCAHGKDRTGVVVLLLLAACGVEREAIVADYKQARSGGGYLAGLRGVACWSLCLALLFDGR